MAPIPDDFVFTLSDNDDNDNANSNDDEIVSKENSRTVAAESKKRKRNGENLTEASDLTNGKKKPSKKAKKHSRKGATKLTVDELPQVDSDEEETPWKGQGEDDGTMNPDFDFQLGNNIGLVEEFDGWGAGRGEERSAQGRDKKGVDIDEIIKRRREKDEVDQANTADEHAISLGDDAERDEEVSDADRAEDADEDEDEVEDELLAEDAFGMGAIASAENVEGDATDSPDGASSVEGSSDDESIAAPVAHPGDAILDGASEDEDEVDAAEIARQEAFFSPNPEESSRSKKSSAATVSRSSFQNMSLSRPVLKGLATLNFSQPTPIQTKTIPLALLGRDLVGGAVTGSGKTAAFLVPILERLLYRPKKVPTSRVAILMPTRELAVQCHAVATKLSAFTDISFVRLVGGYSLREQEAELRLRPDVIIATPGRFIDHMRNSASFTVETLEILVLDEADRMLEDGFADELNEILTTIPKSRQTMLFSATMTSSVDQLIRVGMTRPVRVLVDARRQTVGTLVQEFVRLRHGREEKRLAYLMLLCQNVYTERVIVFFRQKTEAHRVRVVFGLCGIKAAELHGSMSQDQRISAVESFRSGASTHLLATDLASRGLDIKNVSTVINYEAPQSHSIYLHRVGRTARAGRSGRACTLAAESDRKVVRAAVRGARAQTPAATVVSRVMDGTAADAMEGRLRDLAEAVDAVLDEEREERALLGVERDLRKGENFLRFGDEIQARPRRTWFESEKEKKRVEEVGRMALNGEKKGLGKLKGGGKLSGKDKKRLDIRDLRGELGGGWKKGKGGGAGVATAAGGAGKKNKASVGKPVAEGKAKVKGKAMGSKSKSAPKRKAKTGGKLRR